MKSEREKAIANAELDYRQGRINMYNQNRGMNNGNSNNNQHLNSNQNQGTDNDLNS